PEIPQLAVSPAGKMYATWADGRDGDDDVFLRSSSDGGQTWTPARKVNDNGADGTDQFLPKVAIGPGERVSVVFLDGRNDPAKKEMLDAYLATSTDGGKSFENVRLTVKPFDGENIGPTFGDLYGIDFGTRLGLTSGDGKLYASWVDTSAGTPATGRQDVNFAVVDVPSGGNRGAVLAGTGIVVLLAAGLAVVLTRRRPKDPSTRSGAENRQVVSS
ncbi:MAG TPA: sialidase family protein, partial [Acidimicrobiales bacterium]|nr:sialidase family protein [Acidimicrobiales bacterium]